MAIESKLLMILVSFSSAGVAWFEYVKRSQANEILPFRFLWDTRYIHVHAHFGQP